MVCEVPFGYRHYLSLTNDTDKFQVQYIECVITIRALYVHITAIYMYTGL